MEKNQQGQGRMGNPADQDEKRNANAQNEESIHVDSTRLSDYPDGNLDEERDSISTQAGKENPDGRTMEEATDPSKLSDI